MNHSTGKYRSYRVNTILVVASLFIVGGLLYLLKPEDYHTAIAHYQKLLAQPDINQDKKAMILKRMGQLHYNHSNWQGVTTTAKTLSDMGVKDEELLQKALPHIQAEWEKNKTNKQTQDTVVFVAEQLGEKKYVSDFLVWNQRLSEALAIYEKDWQKQQTLPAANLEKALEIALWSKQPELKIRWLERYLIAPPDDTSAEKLTQLKTNLIYLYVDQQDYKNALKHLQSPETEKDYKYLASIYRKDNNYKKVAATYWEAYEKFHDIELLEQAYLILASQADMGNEVIKLLSLLADYKKDYAFRLAEIYMEQKQYLAALIVYQRIWEKSQDVTALQAAYGIAYKLDDFSKMDSLLRQIYKHTNNIQHLKNLAALYTAKAPEKIVKLLEEFPVLQTQPEYITYAAYYYLNNGNYKKAEEGFLKLARFDPTNKKYQQALATIYVEKAEYEKALAINRHIWKRWKDINALKQAYSISYQLKDNETSENILWQLYKHTKDKTYLENIAALYSDEPNKLVQFLEQYPFLQNKYLAFLSSYYLQQKNYDKAENYYKTLIRKHPEKRDYSKALATIYVITGQMNKVQKLIKRYPFLQNDLLPVLASYHLQQKNYRQAEKFYRRLIVKYPKKRDYPKALATIYVETKQLKKVQRLTRQYPYLQQDLLPVLASYYLQNKNYYQAAKYYRQLTIKYPDNKNYVKALATVYVVTKQMNKVQRLTKRNSFLQQELSPVLASHYLQQKNYAKAEQMYQTLSLQHPEKRDYPKVLATIYIETKQMKKLQTLTNNYPFLQKDLLPVLASYYLQHKNYAKAEIYYQKLSFTYPEKRDYAKALASIYIETRQFEKVNLLMAEFPFLRKELLPVLASYYLQKKNYAKAENYYQQLIRLYPKNSEYPAGLASIYIETKQTSKAENLINQYPYLQKNSLAFFASYYLQQKNYLKAEQHYKQLIAKYPRKREYKKILTSIYLETKQIEKALQVIKRYPYLQNDFLPFLASYELQQKNYRQAERSYKKLIGLYPKNRDYPKALAIIYVETKQMRKVQRLTKRYSYLQQGLLPVLASHYLQSKNYKQAENAYKKLIRLYPKKRDYSKALASIYIETKQIQKAQSLIKRYQFLEQELLPVLASYYLQQKNYNTAEIYYRKLIASHPDKTDYPVALASIYVETHQTTELYRLIEEFPFLEENLLPVLASHYLENKDYQKAEKYYQELLNKSPDNQQYPEVLASIYIQTKQEQKLPRLIEQYPILENELLPFLASYNLQQKNYPQAETYYKKLVSRNSDKLDYSEVLASIYVQTEQQDKALPIYEKLYDVNPNKYAENLASHYLYVNKDYSKGIKILERLVKTTNKEQYRLMLAFAYGETNQAGKKATILEQIPLKKISADLVVSLAEAYEQKGRWQKAVKVLNKWHQAQNTNKGKRKVLKHQIYLYQRLGYKKRFNDANMMLLKLNAENML